jgi:hypothetical protein
MTRTRWFGLGAVWFALVLAVPAAAADESPLAQIPAKAPIVISLHGIERTKQRVLTMVKNALPDLAPAVQAQVDKAWKQAFEGRQLKGVKDDDPVFLFFPNMPNTKAEVPNMALVLRVEDYAEFRDGFLKGDEVKTLKHIKDMGYDVVTLDRKPTYFIKGKGYAVITPDQAVAAQLARKDRGPGLDSTLGKAVAARLLAADMAGYVDLGAVKEKYAAQINIGRKAIEAALESAADAGIADLDKNKVQLVKELVGGFFRAFDDSTSVLATARFEPDGLAMNVRLGVAANSASNEFLKKLKPAAFAALKTLPGDFTTYSGFEFGPETYKVFHPIMKILLVSGKEEDKQQNEAIAKALDEMLAARPRSFLSAGMMGAGRASLQVWDYADPARATAAQLRLFQALKDGGEFAMTPLKGKPVIKPSAEKYRGAALHHVRLKWDLGKITESMPGGGEQVADMLKKLIGEGMNVWFGTVEKKYVQVSGKDWAEAKKYLDDYFSGDNTIGARAKAFAAARARLPKKATMVSLIHVPRLAQYYADFLYAMLKGPLNLKDKPAATPAKKSPAHYLGVALTLEAGHGSFDLWVPGTAARDFRRIAEMFQRRGGDDDE